MGCFDSVRGVCFCGGEIEWQSKAGELGMQTYSPGRVPTVIALDVAGEVRQCKRCNRKYTLRTDQDVSFAQMHMEEVK